MEIHSTTKGVEMQRVENILLPLCLTVIPPLSCRYIVSVKVGDSSGEAWVSVFNEQAEALLGMPADQLAEIKDQVRTPIAAFKQLTSHLPENL